MENQTGHVISDPKEIENEVLRFYGELVGQSSTRLKQVDIVALRHGPKLQEAHRDSLIQSVTDQEIWEALKGMGDTKAPCVEEYNAKFFKSFWNVMKIDIIVFIQDFLNKRYYTHQSLVL